MADQFPKEKRRSQREATSRNTLFAPFLGLSSFQTGTTVDISPNGLCIHTRHPLETGDDAEIEIGPRAGSEAPPVLTRGKVMWVAPVEAGGYAMGIRLQVGTIGVTDQLPASGAEIRLAMESVADSFRSLDKNTPSPLAYTAVKQGEKEAEPEFPTRFAKADSGGRKRRRDGLIVVALLLILLMLLPWVCSRKPGFIGPTLSGEGERAAWVGSPAAQVWGDAWGEDTAKTLSVIGLAPSSAPWAWYMNAQEALKAGDLALAEKLFKTLEAHPQSNLTERFISRLGEAEILRQRKQASEALLKTQEALRQLQGIAVPWRETGEAIQQSLQQPDGQGGPLLPLEEAIDLAPMEAPQPPAEIRVEVSTRQYTLTLMKGDEPVASFPIGLGRGGSTPTGSFTMANKLEDPDWYNRGDVVKAGDPANPLGKYWMGLGNQRGPTPYGIHPTNEPESIGGNKSRGCIRMRPEDAAVVFEHCEVGTRIHIAP